MKLGRALVASILALAACGAPPAAPLVPAGAPVPATASSAAAVAPPKDAPPPSDDAAIAAAAQEYVDLRVAISPEDATALGIHTRDTELDDRSLAGFASVIAREEKMLESLRARFGHPNASRASRTDLALMTHALDVDIRARRERRHLETRPAEYLGPLQAIFLMIAREYAPGPERAKNVLARLEKIPAVVAAAKVNLKNPPRVWTQVGIEQAKQAGAFFDDARPFLEETLRDDKPRVDKALKLARQAYADYATFLEKELLPKSNGNFAAGRAYFDFLLHQSYFLDEDADAILAMGKRLFDETDAKMTEVAHRIDPKAKGWPAVTAKVKANHPTAADLLPSYRRELARARAFLVQKDVVAFPPGDDCEVMATPPFERNTITAAYDAAPPFDTKITKGFFFVTPVDLTLSKDKQEQMLRENDHADQVDTTVHEAYPGHHLQLSFSRLHPSIARKAESSNLFSEGWALYSEELLSELGYYTDEERLIQLEWTLVRAARVIIDVGLHTQGMTFDEAVAILTGKVHLERELALSEVKRYTGSPTQPLSYLVGREMIFKLRDRYKQREGEKYTLKGFHTEVLAHGTIAPGLIGQEIFEP